MLVTPGERGRNENNELIQNRCRGLIKIIGKSDGFEKCESI